MLRNLHWEDGLGEYLITEERKPHFGFDHMAVCYAGACMLNELLGTCMGLQLNTSRLSALQQKRLCQAERRGCRRSVPRAPGGCEGCSSSSSALAAGEEPQQRRVMLQSQMGEPVRSKLMCTEGGRFGRATRRRSSSLCTPSAAEVCGWIQSGAQRSRY